MLNDHNKKIHDVVDDYIETSLPNVISMNTINVKTL